jgi:hypothetical protein
VTPLENKKMLASAMLIYGLPTAIKNGTFRAWLETFLHSDDVIFDAKDPLPFLLQFRSLLFYLKLAHQKGISPLEASTFDIEWDGEG